MPTAVVTGGAGFLGSHLCDHLVSRGATASSASTTSTRGRSQNVEHLRGDDVPLHQPRRDASTWRSTSRSTSSTTSRRSPARSTTCGMPLHSLKVGSYGTHNALGLAKFKRARFLLASTSEVYGDPQVHPQPETYWGNVNPIGPRGVYDEAKRYAEALTMAYHSQQGVDTAIVRIFNTYGPRMRPSDGRAVPTFVRQALEGKPLTVFGDGSQTRSFCYVDDLIRGLVAARRSRRAPARQPRQSRPSSRSTSSPRPSSASPARRARSSTRRCRSTTRRSASRTSPARASCSAGSRDSARGGPAPHAAELRTGAGRCVGVSGSRRRSFSSLPVSAVPAAQAKRAHAGRHSGRRDDAARQSAVHVQRP